MEPPPLKSPSKPALITPSASPPPRAYLPRSTTANSHFKRPRLASSSYTNPRASSSSRSTPSIPPINFQKEREASAFRLFDVWSQLAKRYSRRLDEDDIVDITTGEIVKDNGVMRNAKKLGFGVTVEQESEGAGGEDDDGDDDDDDVDELDAFAHSNDDDDNDDDSGGDDVNKDDVQIHGQPIPPVTPMDPLDANDLREFLEAERIRREVCGSEPEDDSDDVELVDDNSDLDNSEETSGFVEDDIEAEETEEAAEEELVEEDHVGGTQPETLPSTDDRMEKTGLDRSHDPESSSEDELNNWDLDEAISGNPTDSLDASSDIEIIEPPATSSCPSSPKSATPTQTLSSDDIIYIGIHSQLQTPPTSYLSNDLAGSPVLETLPLKRSSNIPPIQRRLRRTILRSTSPPATHKKLPSVPQIDLVQVSKSRSPTKRKSATQARDEVSQEPKPLSSPKKLKVEVSLEMRPPFCTANRSTSVSPAKDIIKHDAHPVIHEQDPYKLRSKAKAKGKEKETIKHLEDWIGDKHARRGVIDLGQDSDDPIFMVSNRTTSTPGPEASSSKVRLNQLPAVLKSTDKPSPTIPKLEPQNTLPPRAKKRKRVISSEFEIPDSESDSKTTRQTPVSKLETVPNRNRQRQFLLDSSSSATINKKGKQKHKPSIKSRSLSQHLDSDAGSSSSEYETPQHYRRSQSHFRDRQYPYPPYPHNAQPPHMFGAIPDPRAQFIITQAMHQLSALVGSPWPAPPYTPSRQHRSDQVYTTPMHHPHPYTYTYDPELSHATMPPDSPEVPSSPAKPREREGPRRKSLVKRSRSRGRRVSFQINESDDVVDEQSSPTRHNQKIRARGPTPAVFAEERGKARADAPGLRMDMNSVGTMPRRGRSSVRGQTPGPPEPVDLFTKHRVKRATSSSRRTRRTSVDSE